MDRFAGLVLNHFYFSNTAQKNDRLIFGTFESTADIMIFGSSRAEYHYNPDVITNKTGYSCYNVGYGGQNIYFHKALLNTILDHHKPKLVILELMGIDIEKTAPAYDREKLGALLPFYRKSDHLKNAVLSRGQNEKIKTFCSVYPFNSTVYQILRNNWWPLNNDIKGYIPINKTWNKEIALVSEESNELDSLKIAALFDFVEKCQQSHCKILIAISPHFVLKSSNPGIDKMASAIQDKFGIKILNLEQDSFFLGDKMLFADPFHLNAKGADLYSSVIAMKAKELISNMESHR